MSLARRLFPVTAHASAPNAFTLLNAALGVGGILLASRGHGAAALTLGVLAIPCDMIDGWLARRSGTTSAFGAQLDTLADATSFCLLPAMTAAALARTPLVDVAAVLYALAGLLRLARFGVVGTSGSGADERFEGVPSTFAAACCACAFAASRWAPIALRPGVIGTAVALAALAMVSAIPFPKRGPHVRAMWVIVPLAIAAAWAAELR